MTSTRKARLTRLAGIVIVALLAIALNTVPAYGVFPGANGKIAFGKGATIYTLAPDGTGQTPLVANAFGPAWSPDGKKIAYTYPQGAALGGLWVANADGTDATRIITGNRIETPTWSPDQTRIAYVLGGLCDTSGCSPNTLRTIGADGTNPTQLTGPAVINPVGPKWSPDGAWIAFNNTFTEAFPFPNYGMYLIRPDGSDYRQLTYDPSVQVESPISWTPDSSRLLFYTNHLEQGGGGGGTPGLATIRPNGLDRTPLAGWNNRTVLSGSYSPDGSRLVLAAFDPSCPTPGSCDPDLYLMNADGSGAVNVTNTPSESEGGVDWQPIPLNYIRPKAAAPTRVSLVPAYFPCATANRIHGPPLAFQSCDPPLPISRYLTVGTPDSNGQPAKSIGLVRYGVHLGDPTTPADEADVRVVASVTDVRNKSDLTDYTGELALSQGIRMTDRNNTPNPGGPGPGTVTDVVIPATIPCAATTDATVGSTCTVDTTLDALVPGTVKEGARAVWELGQVKVYDGGSDGDAETTAGADNTLFMIEGLFVP
jgi:hypothetical protein